MAPKALISLADKKGNHHVTTLCCSHPTRGYRLAGDAGVGLPAAISHSGARGQSHPRHADGHDDLALW